MPKTYEIRATFDRENITVYQAFNKKIAEEALKHQTFQSSFSRNRMTWIKPSFLWMMERSNWGRKSNQEHILAIQLKRTTFENILSQGILTSPSKRVYKSGAEWEKRFKEAKIYLQWDPERSFRGNKLEYRSIQIGISRHVIQEYVDEWIVGIKDMTPIVKKMYQLSKKGDHAKAKKHLPVEKVYSLNDEIKGIIGASR